MEIHTKRRGTRWRDAAGDELVEDKRIDRADGRGAQEVFLHEPEKDPSSGAWVSAAYIAASGLREVTASAPPPTTGGA